jgi:hypothetical protein
MERPTTGIWQLRSVVGPRQRDQLLDRLEYYEEHAERYAEDLEFEREDGDGRVRKMRRLPWVDPDPWAALWRNDAVQHWLGELFDEPVGVAYCAAFLKPQAIGSRTPYHQDQALWRRTLEGAVSCWVALDDADETNGCLVFSPGSQARGELPHEEPPGGGHPEVAETVLDGLPREAYPLRAGDAVAWDRYVVHGSEENRSDRPRRAVVAVYAPAAALAEGDPRAWEPARTAAAL